MISRPYERVHTLILVGLLIISILAAIALDDTALHAAGWTAWFGALVSALGCFFYIILKFPNGMLYYPYFLLGVVIAPAFTFFLSLP